jgi:hypothetical protein
MKEEYSKTKIKTCHQSVLTKRLLCEILFLKIKEQIDQWLVHPESPTVRFTDRLLTRSISLPVNT